jgi:CheY-like chemotaxis protein
MRELLGSATHLIALTGYGQDADRRRSIDAGFEAHLIKPVDLGVLVRTIARLTA